MQHPTTTEPLKENIVNTYLTASTATIDAGRMLTLERRRKFEGLTLQITDGKDRTAFVSNRTRPESAGVLSERQIAAALSTFGGWHSASSRGATAGVIADKVHQMMKLWADSGYDYLDGYMLVDRWYDVHTDLTVILRHAE